jgi:uncharacterized protein YjdB
LALLVATPFLSVCTDGLDPAFPGHSPPIQLAVLPKISSHLPTAGSQPINRIRLTAFLVETGEVIGEHVEDVDPGSESWTLKFEANVPELENPHFFVLVELINVSGGLESVEWSGRSQELPLTTGTIPEIREVAVVRGPPVNLGVTSVEILPHDSALGEGDSMLLEASVKGESSIGSPVVFWASATPDIVSVSAGGLVTGLLPGEAQVMCLAGASVDTTLVSVQARPAEVLLEPEEVIVRSLGQEILFTATVVDPRGDTLPEEGVTWEVESPEILSGIGEGRFRSAGAGTTVVIAKSVRNPDLAGSASVTVEPVPVRMEVTPSSVRLDSVGAQETLTAKGWDANDNEVTAPIFSWSSSDPAVVSVDGAGVVTGVSVGSAVVTAAYGTVSASAEVSVARGIHRIEVSPSDHVFTASGQTLQFQAVALDSTGVPVSSTSGFIWSSSNEEVVSVDDQGLAVAVEDGETSISAEAGGVIGSVGVRVDRTVGTLTLLPESVSFRSLGDTAVVSVSVLDPGGSPIKVPPTWKSQDPSVAGITSNGEIVSRGNGVTAVEVTVKDKTAAVGVSVSQVPASVGIRPDSLVLRTLGQEVILRAGAADGRGIPIPDATYSWSHDNPASLDLKPSSGDSARAYARADGEASVTVVASRGGESTSTSALVRVALQVVSVEVAPDSHAFSALGETYQFQASALDANGSVLPAITQFTWSEDSGGTIVRWTALGW